MNYNVNLEALERLFAGNDKALEAIQLILKDDRPVLLTGGAGTGKTMFVRALADAAMLTSVCAPTGIAALNAGGVTVNSLFHIPGRFVLPDQQFLREWRMNEDDRFFILMSEFIIIDEISMVSSALLDCIDIVLQYMTSSQKPFGGMKMIFVGDPYQLPPVIKNDDRKLLSDLYESEYFFHAESYQSSHPYVISLEKVYRQNDQLFYDSLNSIRRGSNVSKAVYLLNSKCYNRSKQSKIQKDPQSIYLGFHNKTVEDTNLQKLALLRGELRCFEAIVTGEFEQNVVYAERILKIKVGARVMFTINDFENRFVNGTLGYVREITDDMIKVETDSGLLVELTKSLWKNFKRTYYYRNNKKVSDVTVAGTLLQFPLKLAWAISVHKSQGLTFDKVYLDNYLRTFAPGQLYVALSRCTSMEGLALARRIRSQDVIIDSRVAAFARECNL